MAKKTYSNCEIVIYALVIAILLFFVFVYLRSGPIMYFQYVCVSGLIGIPFFIAGFFIYLFIKLKNPPE